jgi:hypothetical protein
MPRSNFMLSLNYKHAFFVYCLLFLGLTSPFILFGEVVAPHRQYNELLAVDSNQKFGHIQNRYFSDDTNFYIPEAQQSLHGARSGWITLWTNQNELGRPIMQGGYSLSYLPSWLFSKLTDNPWRFISAWSLFNCFFAGLFLMLFCREACLSPLAGLIAGISFGASPCFMFWLTFPIYMSAWCWAAGVLWGLVRLAKIPDLVGWGALAFISYSLLMTAYQQLVVFYAYILAPYGLYLAYKKQQWSQVLHFSALAVSALIVGAALALPMYIDLMQITSDSARISPDPSFFTFYLPKFSTWLDALKFLVLSSIPELFGNPVEITFPFGYPDEAIYPFSFYSSGATPLVVFFSLVGLATSYKKSWGWLLAIAFVCAITFLHPLFDWGVKYLGFNLSRTFPFIILILPVMIIAAYGVDALDKRDNPEYVKRVVWISAALTIAFVAIGVGFGLSQTIPIRLDTVMVMVIVVGLLAAQYNETRPVLVLAAVVLLLATSSFPVMLRQDPSQIATTSPLVESMRANLPDGSRYAIAAPGMNILTPNLNSELGLPSVHSYNSLSITRYHGLIKELGGTLLTYGRWNKEIAPDYGSAIFWMSNIGLILAPTMLSHDNLSYVSNVSGVNLYKVNSRMGESLQVVPPQNIDLNIDHINFADVREWPSKHPVKVLDQGDFLEFEVSVEMPSIFILSQKYYRNWHAQVLGPSGWLPAETVLVNGVFQGVRLPENVKRVRLEYKPYIRFAWIAHVFWLLFLIGLVYQAWHKRYLLK